MQKKEKTRATKGEIDGSYRSKCLCTFIIKILGCKRFLNAQVSNVCCISMGDYRNLIKVRVVCTYVLLVSSECAKKK